MSQEDDIARREAARTWVAKLSRRSVDNADLAAFFAWRRDPANRRIWDALAAGRRRTKRFAVRPVTERFKVADLWTGQPVVVAAAAQDDLSEEEALKLARRLNRRAADGDRSVPE
jgi:ferric-dicitrate binding protein FerR (iron transport regulator)